MSVPNLAFGDLAQVLAVGGLAVLGGGFQKLFLANPSVDVGDFFDSADLDALAVFDHLHELTCFDKAVHGAGVEPGKSAAQEFHIEFALLQVNAVEIRDFKFSTSAGLLCLCKFGYAVVVEIKSRDGVIALRLLRLFFDRNHLAVIVEFHDAETFRIFDVVTEDACAAFFFGVLDGSLKERTETVPVEDVVAEDHGAAVVTDEFFAKDECLGESIRAGLYFVRKVQSHGGAVAEQPFKIRQVRGSRDDKDVADARQHKCRKRVVDHGLVVNRQKLLTSDHGERVKSCTGAPGENDSFH